MKTIHRLSIYCTVLTFSGVVVNAGLIGDKVLAEHYCPTLNDVWDSEWVQVQQGNADRVLLSPFAGHQKGYGVDVEDTSIKIDFIASVNFTAGNPFHGLVVSDMDGISGDLLIAEAIVESNFTSWTPNRFTWDAHTIRLDWQGLYVPQGTYFNIQLIFKSNKIYRSACFRGLGDLPGGIFESVPFGMTPDGRIVVGYSQSDQGQKAFKWESGVMTGLADLPEGYNSSSARAISNDGTSIAGDCGGHVVRWINGVPEDLGVSPNASWLEARNMSENGNVIVGYGRDNSDAHYEIGFRWEDGNWTELHSTTHLNCVVASCSVDGSVIVGYMHNGSVSGEEAFHWEGGVLTGLGDFPGGMFASIASNISPDGTVILGYATSESHTQACRWVNGVVEALGDLQGEIVGLAIDSTADNQIIIGYSQFSSGPNKAFIWDPDHGIRQLQDVLTAEYNLNLNGWTLTEAHRITPDGSKIIGIGINPSGQTEGWIVDLGCFDHVDLNYATNFYFPYLEIHTSTGIIIYAPDEKLCRNFPINDWTPNNHYEGGPNRLDTAANTIEQLFYMDVTPSVLLGPATEVYLCLYAYYVRATSGSDPPGVVEIYENTAPWQVENVTWNTAPPVKAAPLDAQYCDKIAWYAFDITTAYNQWITNLITNFGLRIVGRPQKPGDGGWDGVGTTFYSTSFVPFQGDFNHDGSVNILDLQLLASSWLLTECKRENDWCSLTDLNKDGRTELDDLLVFLTDWLD